MIAESKKTSPIGIFDSGVGGLTVVKEIIRQLPNENLVYFGDNARVPYGSKSPSTIKHFSSQITRFLLTKDVKAIVVACNTASAVALEDLKEQFDLPIMGVVVPGARAVCESTKTGKIGVVGTDATVRSGIYTKIINQINPELSVIEKACPLFVPLVEEGFKEHHVTKDIIDYYLKSMKEMDINAMILGCTHYPLLRSLIKEYLGEKIHLVNPAYETARDLLKLLEENEMVNDQICKEQNQGKYDFYVSDGAEKFHQFANTVMSIEVPKTNVINIENY
jgi:glutamate racemase